MKRVVNWLKSKITSPLISPVPPLTEENLEEGGVLSREIEFETEEDPLYKEAKRVVTEARKASASLLQRKLRIGYARAARLIDIMEERGVVGPGEGAKPREILIKTEKDEENEGWQKL